MKQKKLPKCIERMLSNPLSVLYTPLCFPWESNNHQNENFLTCNYPQLHVREHHSTPIYNIASSLQFIHRAKENKVSSLVKRSHSPRA